MTETGNLGNYVVDNEDVEGDFSPLPAGDYVAIISESDMVPTRNQLGRYLQLVYEIIEGPGDCKGRKIYENLNLENSNDQAVAIAKKSLNAIGVATGVIVIKDSSQLHGIPLIIRLGVKDDPEYGKKSVVKRHLPRNGAQQTQNGTGQMQKPQQVNAGPDNFNKPVNQPWNRQ